VRLEEVDEPEAGPGEVLLRVAYNGLCGSDVHEYFDGPTAATTAPHPLTGCSLPCILGHEFSGVVVDVGAGVEDVPVGSSVAVEPIETCGTCARCRGGARHLCRQIAFHGYNRSGGGLSDYTVVRRDMVHVLPGGLSAMHGALVEPMAVARRAVRRTGARPGDLVAVHGAGPIGLGSLLALRRDGIDTVVIDPSPSRRSAALALGATCVIDPSENVVAALRDATSGIGVAASVDAAGAESAFQAAVRTTRPDGVVVIVAHHHEPIQLRSGSLIFGEVQVTGSAIYDSSDVAWVIEAMEAGAYRLEGWVTTIELDRVVDDGLTPLRSRESNKILVSLAGG
jgi:(R,R)-butanediol dehydrogenase/meso-butanediol dehydrogenase/diacetyl reductase